MHERVVKMMALLIHPALLLERFAHLLHFLLFRDAPELVRRDQTTRHRDPPGTGANQTYP
jgi:hypothetical protein